MLFVCCNHNCSGTSVSAEPGDTRQMILMEISLWQLWVCVCVCDFHQIIVYVVLSRLRSLSHVVVKIRKIHKIITSFACARVCAREYLHFMYNLTIFTWTNLVAVRLPYIQISDCHCVYRRTRHTQPPMRKSCIAHLAHIHSRCCCNTAIDLYFSHHRWSSAANRTGQMHHPTILMTHRSHSSAFTTAHTLTYSSQLPIAHSPWPMLHTFYMCSRAYNRI